MIFTAATSEAWQAAIRPYWPAAISSIASTLPLANGRTHLILQSPLAASKIRE
jgi:hypothetical protein